MTYSAADLSKPLSAKMKFENHTSKSHGILYDFDNRPNPYLVYFEGVYVGGFATKEQAKHWLTKMEKEK